MHLARKTSVLLFIFAVIALCSVELLVTSSTRFPQNGSILALVITIDLLVGIPLLFYGLVVRPYRFSPITIAPVFLLAVIIAGYILPSTGWSYLDRATGLVPLIALVILCFGVWKARAIYLHCQHMKPQQLYFIDALESSVQATVGNNPAINMLIIEFALIFLAFFGWFMKFSMINPHDQIFTYHRKSRYPMIFLVFLLLIGLETIGLHLLIQHWSPLLAWILTVLSIYSMFWMIGDFNALRLHPIVPTDELLYLRSGFRWHVTLPLADIVDARAIKLNDAKSTTYLSFARAGEAQLVLVLKQPVRVNGLFGMMKEVARIGIFLDELSTFRIELDRRRQANESFG